jgi:hypothetical protein
MKVHYCVQKNPSLDPVLKWMNPVHIVTPYSRSIPSGLFPYALVHRLISHPQSESVFISCVAHIILSESFRNQVTLQLDEKLKLTLYLGLGCKAPHLLKPGTR